MLWKILLKPRKISDQGFDFSWTFVPDCWKPTTLVTICERRYPSYTKDMKKLLNKTISVMKMNLSY